MNDILDTGMTDQNLLSTNRETEEMGTTLNQNNKKTSIFFTSDQTYNS